MSFRDSLKAFIVPEKLAEAEKVFDKLDEQLDGYAADIRTLKQTVREKDGIKPEDFAKLEKENDELRKVNAESARALKKSEDIAKQASETAAQYRERTHKLVRDEGLTKALAEGGVTDPVYLKMAHAFLRDSIQVDDDKGEAFALVTKDGKESRVALGDHVKAFLASDEGKKVVTVPGSSGGGSQGGGGGNLGPKTMTRAAFEALDASAKMTASKEGVKLTD